MDNRARKRYNRIQNVAKTIRNQSKGEIQTCVRNGRLDFLLRQKKKGDITPWGQIPPLKLDQNLPELEVGLYKNIYQEEEEEDEENIEDEQEEDEISNEILRQYQNETKTEETNKQNLSKS